MLPQALAATWGINISPSVKVKVTTHRLVPMLVMLKQPMMAGTQQLMAVLCRVLVYRFSVNLSTIDQF